MGQDLTKEILKRLNNKHTKVKELSDINFNYYNYITDTIYLSSNEDNNSQTTSDKTNLACAQLVTICHECIHSVQRGILHVLNLVLSNISLVLTMIAIILMFIGNKPTVYITCSGIIIVLAILIRLILEIDAIYRSLNLAQETIDSMKKESVNDKDICDARKIIKRRLPIQIVIMVLDKIIMLFIVLV